VEDALGLLGILLFIACVIGLAAGVTWLVVKISPLPSGKDAAQATTKDT
jgi:hypothetical protein